MPDLADPQSHHRYAYVRGNPLNAVDPSGRVPYTVVMLPGLEGLDQLGQINPLVAQMWDDYMNFEGDIVPNGALADVPNASQSGTQYADVGNVATEAAASPSPPAGATFAEAAANGGGSAAGVAEYSNVTGGQWKGSNGKWYAIAAAPGKSRPFFGNQYAGSRSQSLGRAGIARGLGRALFAASAGMSIADGYSAWANGNPAGFAKAGLDLTMSGVAAFGGPVGLGMGTTYFIMDAFGGIPIDE